jgi:hypothetical protein
MVYTKSCECMRRCRQYFCRQASNNQTMCEAFNFRSDRGCYMGEGVPPEQQASRQRGL